MYGLIRVVAVCGILLSGMVSALARPVPSSTDDEGTLIIVLKDGHRQSLAMPNINRIDFKTPAVIVYKDGHQEKITAGIARIEFGEQSGKMLPGRGHFVGKWEVGEGVGRRTFFITLEANGQAEKSLGATHGTWTLFDGEARITWDDGWRDVICKVGTKHEKRAYEPGKTFDDPPSNVTEARNTQPKPI